MVLNKKDLYKITGGKAVAKFGIGVLLTALGTLIVGIIDGYIRPLKCNS